MNFRNHRKTIALTQIIELTYVCDTQWVKFYSNNSFFLNFLHYLSEHFM